MSDTTHARRQAAESTDKAAAKARRVARTPAVARPAYVQPKMAVSHPSDPSEVEADQVAEEISRMPRGVSRQADEQVQPASIDPGRGLTDPDQVLAPTLSRSIHRLTLPEEKQSLAPKLSRQSTPADDSTVSAKVRRQAEDDEEEEEKEEEEEVLQPALLRQAEANEENLRTKLSRATVPADGEVRTSLQRQPIEAEEETLQPSLLRQAETGEENLQAKLSRATAPAEGEVRAKLQRQPIEEEEETLQPSLLRQAETGEENLQAKLSRATAPAEGEVRTKLQRQPIEEEEEMLQPSLMRQAEATEESLRAKLSRATAPAEGEVRTSLQRQPVEEEEEMLQPSPTETAQREDVTEPPAEKETPSLSEQSEQRIDSLRGHGDPLPDGLRREMAQKFSHDFSTVRIHTDDQAAALCGEIRARAFAVGNDLFFAPGEFAPDTEAGRKLLAHELTHVVQNAGGARPKLQRTNGGGTNSTTGGGGPPATPPASGPPYQITSGTDAGTSIDPAARTLRMPLVSLPDFKGRRHASKFSAPITLRRGARGQTGQVENWRGAVHSHAVREVERLAADATQRGGVTPSGTVFLQGTGRSELVVFGTQEQLVPHFEIPFWDKDKNTRSFQVDHIVEDQLGGPDNVGNYELLDASANMSSGSKIAHQIRQRIQAALRALQAAHPGVSGIPGAGDWQTVKNDYLQVVFENFDFNLTGFSGEPDQAWQVGEIHQGRQGALLRGMRARELEQLGQQGNLLIFTSAAGGRPLSVPAQLPRQNWLPRVDLVSWTPVATPGGPGSPAGTLMIDAYKAATGRRRAAGVSVAPDYPAQAWEVTQVEGIYGGVIDRDSVSRGARQSLRLPGMSPIQLDTVDIDDGGIHAEGRVLPTVPLIGDADIRIAISGNEVQLYKTFEIGELAVPPPFQLNDTSLTVFYSTERGIGIEGQARFAIQGIGDGFLGAAASSEGGFELDGEFNFDTTAFDPARVTVGYHDDRFTVGGEIGIPEGKVPGIRSATITVQYEEGGEFSARGDAMLDIPGVEQGTLSVSYSEEAGFAIGGTFNLSPDVPGIRGGTISAELRENPEGNGYSISASGEAQPDIPGINSTLRVSYEDGAITMEAEAQYQRGMLNGSLNVGATNRTLDSEGNPTGEPGDDVVVYGGGSLTIQIAPWLQGTAGVQFAPNGEITVTGEIGLPDQLEIFPRAEIDRSIFNIAVQAPIVPGIVAEIGGGLGAVAGIGPGVIDQLRLGIEYNPAHEENTHITGDAHLNIPADAGLRLSVRAGIGLGITGASATGGLEVGGTLGITGAAEAGVHIDWMPSTGLSIDADVAVHAQPSFTFDISGYVSVRALGFSVYDQTWELASFEFGSDYRFGIRLPVHYREGEPFDISLDDVEFEVPDIDTNQLLRGLIDRVT